MMTILLLSGLNPSRSNSFQARKIHHANCWNKKIIIIKKRTVIEPLEAKLHIVKVSMKLYIIFGCV